uniref:cupin-like domain-containing protein n=1 Tax=Pseudomonas sp. EL_65y_Pfl1_R83 TaxID=3088697 RepID=UPI0030DB08B5
MTSLDSPCLRTVDGTTLDRDRFLRDIAEPCEPVGLRGVCRQWPAYAAQAQSQAALVAYLARFAVDRAAEMFVGDPGTGGRYDYADGLAGFTFSRESVRFGEALGRIADAAQSPSQPSIYVGSLPTDDYLPGFSAENTLSILSPDVGPRIWLGTASSVACHYDTFDNLACVVAGRRRFTLYPPDAIAD